VLRRASGHAHLPERVPLGQDLVVAQRVDRDVGGEVAAPVRCRPDPDPRPVCREGPVARPVTDAVAVVDRQRGAALHPVEQPRPREVSRQADLDAVAGSGRRPEPLAPPQLVAAEVPPPDARPGLRVDEQLPWDARAVDLGQRAGHDVQPLVGHHQRPGQPAELVRQPLAAGGDQPAGRRGEALGPLDHVDTGEWVPRTRVAEVTEQLPAPGPDVDDALAPKPVGPSPQRLGEHPTRQTLGRRREVASRPGGTTVEATRPVQRLLPGPPPRDRVHPGNLPATWPQGRFAG